jgi:hypothetical protein
MKTLIKLEHPSYLPSAALILSQRLFVTRDQRNRLIKNYKPCRACEEQQYPVVRIKQTGRIGHLINRHSGFYDVHIPNGATLRCLYKEEFEII